MRLRLMIWKNSEERQDDDCAFGRFPPFSFVDESNKVVGFDVDIGSEIARRLKAEPEIVTTAGWHHCGPRYRPL